MGQESSRGPKKVAQGVQKVPKGFQKVAKSHEKDIHKASTRHPNAIRKCIGNSVGNSISNAIAFGIHLPSAFPPPCLGLRLPIAVAIALAIALLIELPIEFPMHLLIAFGCLVEAFWMSFSWLFATFWKPFDTFWTPRATFFGPRDDSWPISGPGCNKLRTNYNLVELWWPRDPQFETILVKLMTFWRFCFCCFFGAHFAHKLQFQGPFGGPICDVFWVPGTVGNRLKTWRGYDFHILGFLFGGTNSKLDREGVF